jgi:hypothetical protein
LRRTEVSNLMTRGALPSFRWTSDRDPGLLAG